MKIKKLTTFILLFLLLLVIMGCSNSTTGHVVRDNDESNISLSKNLSQARQKLDLAKDNMFELQGSGFSIVRYNDTLLAAEGLFNNQAELEANQGQSDYYLLDQKINELEELKNNAYLAKDELTAVMIRIEATSATNTTPIYELYNKSSEALTAERYEEALELIEKTYDKISEMEATETKVKAFYAATSRTFKNFLEQYWINITVILIALISGAIILHRPISRLILYHKIQRAETRADSIKNLVAETQKDFFEKQTMDESTYHVRIKKYGELLRDVHRQVPLLKEKLALHERKKKKR